MVLGFKLTTLAHESPPITTRPGLQLNNIDVKRDCFYVKTDSERFDNFLISNGHPRNDNEIIIHVF